MASDHALINKLAAIFTIMAIALISSTALYTIQLFQPPNTPQNNADRDTLYQIAAFNTFANGSFQGFMPYSEIAKHGDFGIGTLDGLDGEMIAINGIFYHIPADGKPKQINPDQTAPYATVTFFEPDQTLTITNQNYTQIQTLIDNNLPNKNAIYAIKITGTYNHAQTRSPHKQTQPYPTVTEALKNQATFTLNNTKATAAGFIFPQNMNGIDNPGHHLHLITDDKTAGGHLLEFTIANATIQIDQTNSYHLILP